MNERELFLAALDIEDPMARRSHLQAACAGDAELLARVELLLESHEAPSQFLNTPIVEQMANATEAGLPPTTLFRGDSTNDSDPEAPTLRSDRAGSPVYDQDDSTNEHALGYLEPSSRPDSLGRLGHYEVLENVGHGAFGTVLRAFDEKLQRVVAIKVMAPELATTSPARKRFLREARASAAIRHENVVSIYAVEEKPLPHLVMEFIPGQTLQQRLNQVGPLNVPTALRYGRQIAEGLAAAHAQDLIHRDIKPGNILLETGVRDRVKITDFGLARTADDASMTQSGVIAGTPMYMAPEQAQGHKLDQRADLFSLGSVLYQMVSGRPPFRASSTLAVLKRLTEEHPRPIREIIPETPQWLCDIITKLHAKNPDERYQSAREIADVLANCETQLSEHSGLKDFSLIPSAKPQPARRRKLIATLAGLFTLVVLVVGFKLSFDTYKSGVVTIQCDDPEVVISVDDKVISLNQFDIPDGVQHQHFRSMSFGIAVGEHRLWALKAGKLAYEQFFTIDSGETKLLEVVIPKGQRPDTAVVATEPVDADKASKPVPPPVVVAPLETAQAQTRWDQLFNGKDLSGWKTIGHDGWPIANGILIGKTQSDRPGILFTERKFTDYELELEVKLGSGADTGIFLRVGAEAQPDGRGLTEFQLIDNIVYANLPADRDHGALLNLAAPTQKLVAEIDGWQTVRIQVEQSRVRVWLNGKPIIDHKTENLEHEGSIGLQIVTGQIEFRNMRVRDLPPAPLPIGVPGDAPTRESNSPASAVDSLRELVIAKEHERDQAKQSFRDGELTKLDVVYAELDATEARIQLTQAENDVVANLMAFRSFVAFRELERELVTQTLKAGAAKDEELERTNSGLGDAHARLGRAIAAATKTVSAQTIQADRRAAEYVMSVGGKIRINCDEAVYSAAELPQEVFLLTGVNLNRANLQQNHRLTDADLEVFKDCEHLTYLDLGGDSLITDAGLAGFAGCRNLTVLVLWQTQLTDAGLSHLKDCRNLTKLWLDRTPITDAGLKHLSGMTKLDELYLAEMAHVTPAGIDELTKTLPKCTVRFSPTFKN